jgi:hypothetical protein
MSLSNINWTKDFKLIKKYAITYKYHMLQANSKMLLILQIFAKTIDAFECRLCSTR